MNFSKHFAQLGINWLMVFICKYRLKQQMVTKMTKNWERVVVKGITEKESTEWEWCESFDADLWMSA